MAAPLCKGVIFTAGRAFVAEKFGPAAVERVLESMSPTEAALLRAVLPVGWYPLDPIVRFQRHVDRVFGAGDLALCREMGRFAGEWQLNSVLKVFLRTRSPDLLFERGTKVWRQYHDSGRWDFERFSPTSAMARCYDFIADEAWCMRFEGFLERVIELSGGREPRIEHPECRGRGHDHCEYVGRWS